MENQANQSTYPQMSTKNWWNLRSRFIQTVPASVTAGYIASVLSMNENSARNNVLRPLKHVGLVDNDSKPTERAYDWRDDDKYRDVCQKILSEVYPQELLDAFPDDHADRSTVARWFQNSARIGQNAANKAAGFYILLLEGDPAKQSEMQATNSTVKAPTQPQTKRARQSKTTELPQKQPSDNSSSKDNTENIAPSSYNPSLHIDVQVHISPESSAEQIDTIFASMAKHLYKGQI